MEMEVICISSDESDSQKENKTDKFVTNSIETRIGGLAHGKAETFSDNEKVEENNLKRKKLQTDKDEVIQNMEKRKRLNSDQGTSKVTNKSIAGLCSIYTPEIRLVKSDYNTQSNQKTTIEKTQLIVKEKKKISYVSQDVFPLFMSLCLQKCPKYDKEDMVKIIDKLKRHYENMDPIYARSENFVLFLNQKREAIMNNNKKMYVYIEDVKNEMKKKVRKKQVLQNNEIYDAVPSTSYTANNLSVNNGVESNNDDNDDANENYDNDDNDNENNDNEENTNKKEQQISTKRKIKQVLHTMKKCEASIRRLEEEEVDFDDENDSNYIKVERYKRRMTELYNKLCELTGENVDAGRVYLRPKHFNVTRIVAVDQAITNFINSKIIRRNQMKKTDVLTDNLIFPDYRDILECVNRCNDRKNLGLDKKRCEQMAERAFKELGEHLQRTRRNDYWDTFSLYLENTEDPAIKDESLARKLAENRIEGDKRLTAVFEKYAKKQEEIKDQNDEETASIEDEDEEEESIIDDKDKSDENLSMTSEKDSDNEDDIDEKIKENRLSMEKNKPNISMVNISMDAKVVLNKPTADALQEKCNEIIKVKVWKKSDTVVSKDENKTINEKIIHKPCTSNTILKNVIKNITVIETQEDSPDSTANCTKDLAEVKTIEVSKAITDPATKKGTKIVADTITGVATELITKDTAEPRTEDAAELITEDVTETITENIAEIITDKTENMVAGMMENIPNDEQPEEEKKPVLRLRSFAKPPTTWEDSQHKMDKITQKKVTMSKVVNQVKEIVDLTNEGTAKPTPVIAKCAVQLGVPNKVVPILKHQLVIPANRNIISVQNITNNYLKVNTRTGQIIAPVRDICRGSTIIRLPIQSTNRQNQPQNVNDIALKNEIPLKRNETILKRTILIPKKSFIISKKSTVQPVSKQTDVSSSTTNSK